MFVCLHIHALVEKLIIIIILKWKIRDDNYVMGGVYKSKLPKIKILNVKEKENGNEWKRHLTVVYASIQLIFDFFVLRKRTN